MCFFSYLIKLILISIIENDLSILPIIIKGLSANLISIAYRKKKKNWAPSPSLLKHWQGIFPVKI